MTKTRFDLIYKDLRQKIEKRVYDYQTLLPSENEMSEIYGCSRNTYRRAISMLAKEGYVQSVHGKGVIVLYQPLHTTTFSIGSIESFHESATRNHLNIRTEVKLLSFITVDSHLAAKTGFAEGTELYYIQRVRYINDKPVILDINLFSKEAVPGLTEEIARHSIYNYIENDLGMSIITSKRLITIERVTEADEKYLSLDLDVYNCLAVVTSQTFNSEGVMFEYTCSRHRPDYFSFQDIASRNRTV